MRNMERNSFWFLKQFLDAVDTDDFSYAEKSSAIYTLCYYAIKGVFPHEASGMDKMLAKSNEKLLEGQDIYRQEKIEKGANGGKAARITDEQIKGAYIELYEILGRHPKEQEVIDRCGGGVGRIASRKIWKEDKNEWIKNVNVCIDKQDIQNPYKDIHTHTYTDF